jgi:hypothetical protein
VSLGTRGTKGGRGAGTADEAGCRDPGPLAGAHGAGQGDGTTQKRVHWVIRAPDGDYGKEFTGQHCLTSPHPR